MDEQAKKVAELEAKIAEMISGKIGESLDKVVSEKLDAKMKELGMSVEDAKKGNVPAAFLGLSPEETAKMTKGERAAKFVKACLHKDMDTLRAFKALSEGTDSAGGFLVPEEFRSEVYRIANDYGLARKLCTKIPMKRDVLNMPTLSSSVTVYWPGEGAAGTESNPVFGRTRLEAKTMVGLTVMSNELLEDADVDIISYIAELFAEAMAGEEDNQLFNGTGNPFTGIFNNSSVNVVTMATGQDTFAETLADDLRDLISQVKATALPGAAYFMHRTTWGSVQKIKQNSNHVVALQNPMITPASAAEINPNLLPVGTIWGYPVYLSDQIVSTTAVSTKFIAFGNLKYAWFGDRKQMTMKISDSATVGSNNVFAENESAVRFTERVAIAVGLPTAFAVLKTAAS